MCGCTKNISNTSNPPSKFEGGGCVSCDLNHFDVSELDNYETMLYNDYIKHSTKEEALQLLINSVEGDYSQLSPKLAEIAEKYYGDVEYANGGELKKIIKLASLSSNNNGYDSIVYEDENGLSFANKSEFERGISPNAKKLALVKSNGEVVKYENGGGLGSFSFEVVIDGDYDEPKKFRNFNVAKNYIIGNYNKHETMELLDEKGDSVSVSKDDSLEDVKSLFEFKNGGELKANDIPLGTWLKHKTTKTKAKVWDVDPITGRMKLEDIYGNKDNMWRYPTDWKLSTSPIESKLVYGNGGGVGYVEPSRYDFRRPRFESPVNELYIDKYSVRPSKVQILKDLKAVKSRYKEDSEYYNFSPVVAVVYPYQYGWESGWKVNFSTSKENIDRGFYDEIEGRRYIYDINETSKFGNGGGVENIESEINDLYSKFNFINDDFNWKMKLLEMLQDRSIEAYNIYQSLSENQKEEVLQALFEADNDMGSDGDGELSTSKENLDILLEDAKNGNKLPYSNGGTVEIINQTYMRTPYQLKKMGNFYEKIEGNGGVKIYWSNEGNNAPISGSRVRGQYYQGRFGLKGKDDYSFEEIVEAFKNYSSEYKESDNSAITKGEYKELLQKYDKLTGLYEDETDESVKSNLQKEIEETESKIHRYERSDEYANGGGVSSNNLGTIKYGEYKIVVKKTDSPSNYNRFASVYKIGEKTPLIGTTFKETSTKKEIKDWAVSRIGMIEKGVYSNGGGIGKAIENLHSKASKGTISRGKNKIKLPVKNEEFTGRGWGSFEKGERINSAKDLKVGVKYLQYNPQFNSKNIIIVTSGDKTPLNRDIAYASFLRPEDLKSKEEDFAIWGSDLKNMEVYEIKGEQYAKGGGVSDLEKELRKLQRDLNSSRLSTYIEGDNSEEAIALKKEREVKLARFHEVLRLLNEKDSKYSNGGGINDGYELKMQPDYKYPNIANRWLEDNSKDSKIYKLAVMLLLEQKDPDEKLGLEINQYDRLLRRLDGIALNSKHEMSWRTNNYTTSEAEKWAKESVSNVFYLYKDMTKYDNGGGVHEWKSGNTIKFKTRKEADKRLGLMSNNNESNTEFRNLSIGGNSIDGYYVKFEYRERKAYSEGGDVCGDNLSGASKTFSKSSDALVRDNLFNGEISVEKLKSIIGHEPNYPTQIVGSIKLTKCFLKPFYKI